jgi:hypothetical protein
MGVVHEARGPAGQTVALKLLLERDEVALKRFEREARSLAALSHPNIVRVHQYGQAPEGPYLVTELVPGEGLDRVCARGALPPERAAEIVRQLADAVARAHAAGVLHRDLKPQNVILRPDGTPVLLDFGLARTESAERLTQTGALVGTPAYMAPEQAGDGAHAIDERADVYGLGALLFHLLHARPPFSGDGPVQLVKRVIMDEPDWPSPAVAPPALGAVCRMAMSKDRQARYAGAAALRDDLARFLRGEPTRAQPSQRSKLSMILGGVGALALAGGALALAVHRPEVPPVEAPPTDVATSSSAAVANPLQEAERALRDAKGPRAVAVAAARLLELSPKHVQARRALEDARQQKSWKVSLGAPSGARFLPRTISGPRLLLFTSGGGTARVWDLARPAEDGPIATRPVASDMSQAAIDPGRRCAWMTSAGQVIALPLPSLEEPGAPIQLPTEDSWSVARSVALSRDGAWLALACARGSGAQSAAVLVDLASRRATAAGKYDFPIIDVTFDRAGALWAVGGKLTDAEADWSLVLAIDTFVDGVRAPALTEPGSTVPSFVADGPDGAVVVGTVASELTLLDRARKHVVTLRSAYAERIRRTSEDDRELPAFFDAVGFAGRWLIVASGTTLEGRDDDNAVLVYDLERAEARVSGGERLEPAWTVLLPRSTHATPVSVDVSDDGELILVVLGDGEVLALPFCPPR